MNNTLYDDVYEKQKNDDSYFIDVDSLTTNPVKKSRSARELTVLRKTPQLTENPLQYSEDELRSFTEIVKEKDVKRLNNLGGVKAIAESLQVDVEKGLPGKTEEISLRQSVFGANTYDKPPEKGFSYFVYEAFQDILIIILLVCAIFSLGFGIKEYGASGWYDGGSIFIAVFLVVIVSAVSNFSQSRQFAKLSKISNEIQAEVLRDGQRQKISVFDIVVGDIVYLYIGDQIPADGLCYHSQSLQIDESSMTGESEQVDVDDQKHPFLLSGTKVVDGYGRMLVTSVGRNTDWGEMMSTISRDNDEQTPLQSRLEVLASSIGKVGLSVAVVVLVVLLARYFTGNTKDENGNTEYNGSKTKFDSIMNSVVRLVSVAVTIVVVAIPEGLPLAVTVTLAYSMKRMMADNAMVRKLSACETMGSATTICTGKTGTLTLNQMKVTKFWLGLESIKGGSASTIPTAVLQLIHQGVGLNTSGSVYRATTEAEPEITGSQTEKAILSWAVSEAGMDIEEMNQNYSILNVEGFSSEKKRSGVLIKKKEDSSKYVHWKGAAEKILAMCSNYYDSHGKMETMSESKIIEFETIIQNMAVNGLRCIAFAHKHIEEEELQEDGLALVGIVGIKDPCRPGVKNAVKACQDAGVTVKMITGDNVYTARAIAIECGILDPDLESNEELVVEGEEFRNLTGEERMEKVEKICVMARSSPRDKLLMVQCLKRKGHVVAVTGDGTNDAPALNEADIGLSMGIQGTEVAKESSDIVILDDNFSSVATVLQWGRGVYNNIQKFIQFQLTVNIAALAINFVAAVSAGEVPLTAVQLLWVYLIMDTLAALALVTEKPTPELMKKPPVGRTAPLITNVMWRNLLTQAIFQIAVLLTLQFKGKAIFSMTDMVKDTIIFNTFVMCQVFNLFNARSLEKKNVFKGIHKNKLFLGIVGITVVFQVVMVEFLKAADTKKLNWVQWCVSVGIGAVSWPIAWVVKGIPVPEKPIFDIIRQVSLGTVLEFCFKVCVYLLMWLTSS
ncbi:P-type Ca(2+) transporter [Ranunculus cassubicifolius]